MLVVSLVAARFSSSPPVHCSESGRQLAVLVGHHSETDSPLIFKAVHAVHGPSSVGSVQKDIVRTTFAVWVPLHTCIVSTSWCSYLHIVPGVRTLNLRAGPNNHIPSLSVSLLLSLRHISVSFPLSCISPLPLWALPPLPGRGMVMLPCIQTLCNSN